MRTLILTILAMAAALAGAPASAQTEQLPTTSRSEQQVIDLNGAMMRRERDMRSTQQNQFEVNQLRSQLSRDAISIPPPISVPPGRICAPGSVAC